MSFRLESAEAVEGGLKRIVHEELEKAIAEVDDPKLPRDEAVHQVRKRCKKIRGAVRLVQPVFGDHYRIENTWFREAARELSALRDAQVMVGTFDALMHHFRRQLDGRRFAPLRQCFVRQRQEVARDQAGLHERLARARARLCEARKRVNGWKLDADGFAAIEPGLLKTYARGRKALRRAYRTCSAPDFHKWRKAAKYHRYQLRLLPDLWPPVMRAWRREAVVLSELLGNDHDLAVFRTRLTEDAAFRGRPEVGELLGLVDQRSEQLRVQARPLGERLYAEKPKELGRRFCKYWKADA
jgi:CHAD domain-containing protein